MTATRPMLSLILCSRNDRYMGNSRWRLETTLNYTADRVRALDLAREVEIIVSDWGSDVPLADALQLNVAAAEIVSFVTVPPAMAGSLQGDSPFPEVIALNAAARRARGQYIGRIDQDTVVGERFLRWMSAAVAAGVAASSGRPLAQTLLFANRRNIPYRVAELCPPVRYIEWYIKRFGTRLWIEGGRVIYRNAVGVWLAHRDLWHECGGYDERMIYMNDMEIDMVHRLMPKYALVDLGRLVDYDFYHLDHYHPRGSRSSSTHRPVNCGREWPSRGIRPSGDDWGLHRHTVELTKTLRPPKRGTPSHTNPIVNVWLFTALTVYTSVRIGVDRLVYPFWPRWQRRAVIAWATVRDEPLLRWPLILKALWRERPSANGVVMR